MIFPGGQPDFPLPSPDLSRLLSFYAILMLSQMQVLASGLPSPSKIDGEPGASSQAGNTWMDPKTLVGPNPLVSSSSSERSPGLETLADILRYTEITKELSKAGGTSEVGTNKPTSSFDEYIPSSTASTIPSPYILPSFPVNPTKQMPPPEVSSPQSTFYYPKSNSHLVSTGSLLTHPSLLLPQKSGSIEKDVIPPPLPNTLLTFSQLIVPTGSLGNYNTSPLSISIITPLSSSSARFSANLPSSRHSSSRGPNRYLSNLTPVFSELRPHCHARDRLRLWKPTFTRSSVTLDTEITDEDLDRLITVINTSWQSTTRETYGAGLLVFHVFCDLRSIPEPQRCPADPLLMLTFISSCAGSYSGRTLSNYFYAVRAWHVLHGAPWHMNAAEMKAALDGAAILAPPSSKRPKRSPMTIDIITSLRSKFDLTKPLDAAVFSCLTTTFFTAAQLGEFTLSSLKAFTPDEHIKPSDVHYNQDRHGLQVTVFKLPRTKSSITGEDVFWSTQQGAVDPQAAFANHLLVNNPPADQSLFSWRHPNGLRALTRAEFLKRINLAATELGIDSLKGHGIRIGATLEYLLRGVPFEVVKSIGRWSSEAFLLYLRQHTVIIAPYIQDSPVMEAFTRYTMPPLR